jgi:hypothetical protein
MPRIRIAKTGGTINDAPKDLALDSDITSLMILTQENVAGATTQVSHGLGYYPVVYPFFSHDGFWHPGKSILVGYSDTNVDTANIYIENGSGYDWMYYLVGNAVDDQTGSGKNTASGRLKIAKSGLSTDTITDIRQFRFCSGADLFKADTAKRGSVSVTTSSGNWEPMVAIPHNLGYVPFCSVTDSDLGGELPLDYSSGFYNFYYKMDDTNLYIGVIDFDQVDPLTYNFKYQVYRNKIA